MLTLKKSISITGSSTIDGTIVENYTAKIDSANPEKVTIIPSPPVNATLYKENRATCREDRAEFEEAVYALQDEMIAAQEAEDTETTETTED